MLDSAIVTAASNRDVKKEGAESFVVVVIVSPVFLGAN